MSEISKKYRKLVLKYHPDKAGTDTSERNVFSYIRGAYRIVKDDNKRKIYDSNISKGSSAEDAFDSASNERSGGEDDPEIDGRGASSSIMKGVLNTDYYKSLNPQSRQSQPPFQPTSQSQPSSQPFQHQSRRQQTDANPNADARARARARAAEMREKVVQKKRQEEIEARAKADARAKAAEMREKEVQRKRQEEIEAEAEAEQPFFEGSILPRTFYDGIAREHIDTGAIELLKKFEEMYSNLFDMKEFIDNTLLPILRNELHGSKDINPNYYNTLNTIKMSLHDFYPSDILSMVETNPFDYESFDLDGCIKQILLNYYHNGGQKTNDLDRCVYNIYNMIYQFEKEIENQQIENQQIEEQDGKIYEGSKMDVDDNYVGAGRRRYKNHSKRKLHTKKIRTNKKNSKKQKSKVASKKKQKTKKNNRRRHKSTLKR
jgi:curved DNA-binding protein CbpA